MTSVTQNTVTRENCRETQNLKYMKNAIEDCRMLCRYSEMNKLTQDYRRSWRDRFKPVK